MQPLGLELNTHSGPHFYDETFHVFIGTVSVFIWTKIIVFTKEQFGNKIWLSYPFMEKVDIGLPIEYATSLSQDDTIIA